MKIQDLTATKLSWSANVFTAQFIYFLPSCCSFLFPPKILWTGHCRASLPFGLSFTVEQPSMWSEWKNAQAECGELMSYGWALGTDSVHGCFSASTALKPYPPDSLSFLWMPSIALCSSSSRFLFFLLQHWTKFVKLLDVNVEIKSTMLPPLI